MHCTSERETTPPAVTDEELAEVERADECMWCGHGPDDHHEQDGCLYGWSGADGCQCNRYGRLTETITKAAALAPRLASEVRAGRLWHALALALIASRARGNAPDVLKAIAELEQQGEHVPAVVRL